MVQYCPDCGTEVEESDKICKICGRSLAAEVIQPESNENIKLQKFLEIESNQLNYHGDKIWEEMKHFSWALYILLAAAPLLKFSWNIDKAGFHPIWIIIWPVFAIVVSLIAILTIWRESKHFDEVKENICIIKKKLKFHMMIRDRDEKEDNQSFFYFLFFTSRGYFIWYFIGLIGIGVLEFLYINLDP